MANVYDQFVTQAPAKPATNVYDQFDNARTPDEAQTTLGSAAGNFAGGAVDALLTLPGAVSDLMLLGADKIGQKLGNAPLTREDYANNPLGSQTVRDMFKDVVNRNMFGPEPKTTTERYARRIGEFVGPGVVLGPLNPRTAVAAATGGIGSRAAQDAFPDNGWAPIIGGLLGGLTPGAIKAATGGGMSAETAKLAQQLGQEGVDVLPGQMGSRATRMAYDATTRLPFMGTGARTAQLKQFNSAIAKTFGENADTITPEVMNNARSRIGKEFNDIFARNSIPVDQQLTTDLADLQSRALQNLATPQADQVGRVVAQVLDAGTNAGGALPGRLYHSLTSKGGALKVLTSSADPNIKYFGGQLREALDDAFTRAASPEDVARLKQAKQQFRSMKVVEPLAVKATDGNINPALLLGRVAANDPMMAYSGGGKLGTLARGAKQFLKDEPSSTTPERQMVYGALGSAGVGAGFLAPQVLAPAAATFAGAKALKSLLESRTIGGAMVARAVRRAAHQQSRRQRLTQSANAALPGSVGLAGRQNIPVQNQGALPPR